jgi:hypothetical protein
MRDRVDEILNLIDREAPLKPMFEMPGEDVYSHLVVEYQDRDAVSRVGDSRTTNEVDQRLAFISQTLASDFPSHLDLIADDGQRHRARALLYRLKANRYVDATHGIDYALELRLVESLAREDHNSPVFFALISIAGWDEGLARENHGCGYHFHYIMTKRGVVRTNVLLTFNSTEDVGPPDTLYWEHHGCYSSANPDSWGTRRCRAVHSATRSSVYRPGKANFRAPSNTAKILLSK